MCARQLNSLDEIYEQIDKAQGTTRKACGGDSALSGSLDDLKMISRGSRGDLDMQTVVVPASSIALASIQYFYAEF